MDFVKALFCRWLHGSHWDHIGHFPDGKGLYHCWACRAFRIMKKD